MQVTSFQKMLTLIGILGQFILSLMRLMEKNTIQMTPFIIKQPTISTIHLLISLWTKRNTLDSKLERKTERISWAG